jgi:hypothetical protein
LWKPSAFSQRRNLNFQSKPGVVYRLCGAQFVTSILPKGIFFLSATPAIIPKVSEYLDLITGIALLPAWRLYVRKTIRSTNFTPSAVALVLCPPSKSSLGLAAARIGRSARKIADRTVKGFEVPNASLRRLSVKIEIVDRAVAELLGISSCA